MYTFFFIILATVLCEFDECKCSVQETSIQEPQKPKKQTINPVISFQKTKNKNSSSHKKPNEKHSFDGKNMTIHLEKKQFTYSSYLLNKEPKNIQEAQFRLHLLHYVEIPCAAKKSLELLNCIEQCEELLEQQPENYIILDKLKNSFENENTPDEDLIDIIKFVTTNEYSKIEAEYPDFLNIIYHKIHNTLLIKLNNFQKNFTALLELQKDIHLNNINSKFVKHIEQSLDNIFKDIEKSGSDAWKELLHKYEHIRTWFEKSKKALRRPHDEITRSYIENFQYDLEQLNKEVTNFKKNHFFLASPT